MTTTGIIAIVVAAVLALPAVFIIFARNFAESWPDEEDRNA